MIVVNLKVLQFKVFLYLFGDIFYKIVLKLLRKDLCCVSLLFIYFIAKHVNVVALTFGKGLFGKGLQIFGIIFLLACSNLDDLD